MLIAINPGHGINNNGYDPGAINRNLKVHEHQYVRDLAIEIYRGWRSKDVKIELVFQRRYDQLANDLNKLKPDLIVSLHLDSFDHKASGTTMIHYDGSTHGVKCAKFLYDDVHGFLKLPKRAEPILGRTMNQRGGGLLHSTQAPCIIAESFFISNSDEYLKFESKNKIEALAKAYIKGLDKCVEYLDENITTIGEKKASKKSRGGEIVVK